MTSFGKVGLDSRWTTCTIVNSVFMGGGFRGHVIVHRKFAGDTVSDSFSRDPTRTISFSFLFKNTQSKLKLLYCTIVYVT